MQSGYWPCQGKASLVKKTLLSLCLRDCGSMQLHAVLLLGPCLYFLGYWNSAQKALASADVCNCLPCAFPSWFQSFGSYTKVFDPFLAALCTG